MVINMIVVFGLNFITGLAGQMNLGTAGIYALGAYTSALLSRNFGLSPWWRPWWLGSLSAGGWDIPALR